MGSNVRIAIRKSVRTDNKVKSTVIPVNKELIAPFHEREVLKERKRFEKNDIVLHHRH